MGFAASSSRIGTDGSKEMSASMNSRWLAPDIRNWWASSFRARTISDSFPIRLNWMSMPRAVAAACSFSADNT